MKLYTLIKFKNFNTDDTQILISSFKHKCIIDKIIKDVKNDYEINANDYERVDGILDIITVGEDMEEYHTVHKAKKKISKCKNGSIFVNDTLYEIIVNDNIRKKPFYIIYYDNINDESDSKILGVVKTINKSNSIIFMNMMELFNINGQYIEFEIDGNEYTIDNQNDLNRIISKYENISSLRIKYEDTYSIRYLVKYIKKKK